MEYRLNKIDMEVRERINEATSEKKVHRMTEIQRISNRTNQNKNKNNKNNNNNGQNKEFVLPNEKPQSSKIVVTAVKNEKISIDLEVFRDNCNTSDPDRGSFLDIRR